LPDQSHSHRRHLVTLRRDLPPHSVPERPAKRPRRRIPWPLLAGAALLAAGLVYVRFRPLERPVTVPLAIRSIEVALDADALVVRDEQVYTAPVAGQARRLVPDGQRVRVGSPVVELMQDAGATTTVSAQTSGMLSFQVDGLETVLVPIQAAGWKPAWFKALSAPSPRRLADGRVESGGALFKIVDNVAQSLILVADERSLPAVQAGSELQVRFAGRGDSVEATLARLERQGTDVLLHVNPQRLPAELGGVRRARITLVFFTYTGKVVPRSAIDVRDGQQGVWVLEGKETVFTPARVVGGNALEVVLQTALPPGTPILLQAPIRM